tara:strand:- start:60349 stop:60621 length:273 start_codon:yes stop_codon:yes gene_type:complete
VVGLFPYLVVVVILSLISRIVDESQMGRAFAIQYLFVNLFVGAVYGFKASVLLGLGDQHSEMVCITIAAFTSIAIIYWLNKSPAFREDAK